METYFGVVQDLIERHVWATVEPFEGWKLNGASRGDDAAVQSGPRLNPLRDGNNSSSTYESNLDHLVWATVEPFEGWKRISGIVWVVRDKSLGHG